MKLKPCPFCGEKAVVIENYGNYRAFEVFCGCGGRVAYYETKKEAIKAWNRRANEHFTIIKEDDGERRSGF